MKTCAQNQGLPTKRTEHDIETRSMVLAYRRMGDSFRDIGKKLGISHATVQSIVLKFEEIGSVKNKKRCGRPQILQAEDTEILKHSVLEDRESHTMPLAGITRKLNDVLTTDISQRTVRHTLKEQGISCHAAVTVSAKTVHDFTIFNIGTSFLENG